MGKQLKNEVGTLQLKGFRLDQALLLSWVQCLYVTEVGELGVRGFEAFLNDLGFYSPLILCIIPEACLYMKVIGLIYLLMGLARPKFNSNPGFSE